MIDDDNDWRFRAAEREKNGPQFCKDCKNNVPNNGNPLCTVWAKHYGHVYTTSTNKAPWCQFFGKENHRAVFGGYW
jgi:hypothetical protein